MHELVPIDFRDYIYSMGAHPAGLGGYQVVLRFPNDYGASIIQGWFSYGGRQGKLELAVMRLQVTAL